MHLNNITLKNDTDWLYDVAITEPLGLFNAVDIMC